LKATRGILSRCLTKTQYSSLKKIRRRSRPKTNCTIVVQYDRYQEKNAKATISDESLFDFLHANVAGDLFAAADLPLAVGQHLCTHLTVIEWWVLAIVPVGVVVGRQVGPLAELAVEDSKADPDRFLSDSHFLDEFVLFLGVDGYVVGSFVAAVDERVRPQSVIFEQFVAFMSAFQIGPSGLAFGASLFRFRCWRRFAQSNNKESSKNRRQSHDRCSVTGEGVSDQ